MVIIAQNGNIIVDPVFIFKVSGPDYVIPKDHLKIAAELPISPYEDGNDNTRTLGIYPEDQARLVLEDIAGAYYDGVSFFEMP